MTIITALGKGLAGYDAIVVGAYHHQCAIRCNASKKNVQNA